MQNTNNMQQIKTLLDAVKYFSDERVCVEFVANLRWGCKEDICCPKCGSLNVKEMTTRQLWFCKEKECKKQFSVKVGSCFEKSPLPLSKWLPAMWFICNAKNGISSCELARALGVQQRTAWFMLHRLRDSLRTKTFKKLSGTAVIDFWNMTSTNNTGLGLSGGSGCLLRGRGLTTSSNSGGVSTTTGGVLLLDNPSISEATKYTTGATDFSRIQVSRHGGDDTDHRIYECNALISQKETTTVHSPATYGKKHSPASFHISARPFIEEHGAIAVNSGTLFTFSIWVRRSSTNVGAKLILRGGQLGSTTQTATASAGANTWEELTVSFTPDDRGMVVVELQSYQISGSGDVFWSDTSGTTQA